VIKIERELSDPEYELTLIHELIHLQQSVEGREQSETECYGVENIILDKYRKVCYTG
jgi:hypothetical protein